MNICRWGAAVGALGPYLYICGGSDDASRLETVERYDPFGNVWVPSVAMATSRNGVGVAAGNGRIYAVGKWKVLRVFDNSEVSFSFQACFVGALDKISALQPESPGFISRLCRVLNLCVTFSSKSNSGFHSFEVGK